MDDVHIPFLTAFCRRFIPKGSRLPRYEFPLTNGVAVVRQVQANEARIAFRITSKPQSAATDTEMALNLLHYADEVWWPAGDYLYSTGAGIFGKAHELLSVDEWRNWIGENHDLLNQVPKGIEVVRTESQSRQDLSNNRAEVSARTQSIIFYNYIAFEGAIYSRGGIPIYAQWLDGNRRRVVVASAGADRGVIAHQDFRSGPPLFERSESQRAFREGRFWKPENEIHMRATLTRSQQSCSYIQVLLHELIPPRIEGQIQLDAMFREVFQRLRWFLQFVGTSIPYDETPDPGRLRSFPHSLPNRLLRRSIFRMFIRAVKPKLDTDETTKFRRDALRSFFQAEKRIPKKHTAIVETLSRAFEMLDKQLAAEELTDEDAAALNSIAS